MRVQKLGNRDVIFYNSTKYSSWVMATGDTGFNPFSNSEASAGIRFYSSGSNLFTQNSGRVLALHAKFFGASYTTPEYQDSTTGAFTVRDAIQQVRENGLLTISQDGNVVHEDLLSNLMPAIPTYAYGIAVGAPNNIFNQAQAQSFDAGSNEVKRSNKTGVYFTPPLIVLPSRNISFKVQLNTGSIPAALNTMIVRFELTVEEFPQANATEVRS